MQGTLGVVIKSENNLLAKRGCIFAIRINFPYFAN